MNSVWCCLFISNLLIPLSQSILNIRHMDNPKSSKNCTAECFLDKNTKTVFCQRSNLSKNATLNAYQRGVVTYKQNSINIVPLYCVSRETNQGSFVELGSEEVMKKFLPGTLQFLCPDVVDLFLNLNIYQLHNEMFAHLNELVYLNIFSVALIEPNSFYSNGQLRSINFYHYTQNVLPKYIALKPNSTDAEISLNLRVNCYLCSSEPGTIIVQPDANQKDDYVISSVSVFSCPLDPISEVLGCPAIPSTTSLATPSSEPEISLNNKAELISSKSKRAPSIASSSPIGAGIRVGVPADNRFDTDSSSHSVRRQMVRSDKDKSGIALPYEEKNQQNDSIYLSKYEFYMLALYGIGTFALWSFLLTIGFFILLLLYVRQKRRLSVLRNCIFQSTANLRQSRSSSLSKSSDSHTQPKSPLLVI